MRRFFSLGLALLFFGLVLWAGDELLTQKVHKIYDPGFGDELNLQKNQGLILQQAALAEGNSIPIYGSSELSGAEDPYHPTRFFSGDYEGIQYNLIGRGYSQSIIHLLNLGALGENLRDQKVVIFLSPQWFSPSGIPYDGFDKNFSPQQYLAFLQNDQLEQELKVAVSQRIRTLLKPGDRQDMQLLSTLASQDNLAGRLALGLFEPYYQLKGVLVGVKEKVQAYRILAERQPKMDQPQIQPQIDWDEAREKAQALGKSLSDNNEFYIGNAYYDEYIREKRSQLEGYMKGQSYLVSPEYEDLELLLKVCQSQGIQPLFVSIPVNGPWYDFCGFPKEDRAAYYEKINKLIASYGFALADFSGHEYDSYFLRDTMHLGWKGWVDVNEAIVSTMR